MSDHARMTHPRYVRDDPTEPRHTPAIGLSSAGRHTPDHPWQEPPPKVGKSIYPGADQGAAPRAEGLDDFDSWEDMIENQHMIPDNEGAAPRAEGLDVPTDLLESLVDDEECRFDHHGGCQAHGYLSLQPGELCPQHELKSIIAARLSRPSDERQPESEESDAPAEGPDVERASDRVHGQEVGS